MALVSRGPAAFRNAAHELQERGFIPGGKNVLKSGDAKYNLLRCAERSRLCGNTRAGELQSMQAKRDLQWRNRVYSRIRHYAKDFRNAFGKLLMKPANIRAAQQPAFELHQAGDVLCGSA